MTTRKIGMLEPPVSRKSVCSGERFERRKLSSKPLCVSPELDSTLTSCTASITSRGAGIGTPGPMKSWRRTAASAIARSRTPSGRVMRMRRPIGSVRSRGSTTPLASASRHQSSASPRWRAREQVAAVALDDPRLVEEREALRRAGRAGGRGTAPAAARRRGPTRRPARPRSGSSARTSWSARAPAASSSWSGSLIASSAPVAGRWRLAPPACWIYRGSRRCGRRASRGRAGRS